MSFTFKTEVIGLMCDVDGAFDEIGLFDIHSIKFQGHELDMMEIDSCALDAVSIEGVKQAGKAALEAGIEAGIERYREMCNDNH